MPCGVKCIRRGNAEHLPSSDGQVRRARLDDRAPEGSKRETRGDSGESPARHRTPSERQSMKTSRWCRGVVGGSRDEHPPTTPTQRPAHQLPGISQVLDHARRGVRRRPNHNHAMVLDACARSPTRGGSTLTPWNCRVERQGRGRGRRGCCAERGPRPALTASHQDQHPVIRRGVRVGDREAGCECRAALETSPWRARPRPPRPGPP